MIIFSKKIQKNIDNIPQKCDHIPTQGEEVDCPSAVQGSKLWVDCWQRGGIFGEHHHCFCHDRDDHDYHDDCEEGLLVNVQTVVIPIMNIEILWMEGLERMKKKPGAGPGVKPDTDRQTLSWARHLKVGHYHGDQG